ncbi:MAG: bacteriohemerythrin [Oscillospiraceae bacterium]|nr:bacteriohemerythrin [Oscillospiraceae bacterium]
MWKESLRIGVEKIDNQHKKLFEKIGELIKEVRSGGVVDKQKCISVIIFLKDYTISHFADEEAYLNSIKYPELATHKKLHERFIQTVTQHTKIMKDSDFAKSDVMVFVGVLGAWLLYHVSDADRRYVLTSRERGRKYVKYKDMVLFSVGDVLEKMAGLKASSMNVVADYSEDFEDSVSVKIEFTDGAIGYTNITYPVSLVKSIISDTLNYMPETIGELEMSATFEVSNIIGGLVCRQITASSGVFCDIKPPVVSKRSVLPSDERVAIDTGKGIVEVAVAVSFLE